MSRNEATAIHKGLIRAPQLVMVLALICLFLSGCNVAHRPTKVHGALPMSFEANLGQAEARVKFVSRGRGYEFFLTSTEAVLISAKSRVTMRILGAHGDASVARSHDWA